MINYIKDKRGNRSASDRGNEIKNFADIDTIYIDENKMVSC